MQDERTTTTIAVNVDDLQQLAYFAAQGILLESEDDFMDSLENELDLRAELGRMLAMAFAHGNLAADAQNQDGTRTPRTDIGQLIFGGEPYDLPYREVDILDALAGKLTSRQLAA
jgi:hypothetical protein